MNTTSALFYVFSAVLLFAAFRVITARSTVHAALFLVLSFFSASCVWMLLQAEFLFVVMMLDINTDSFREGFWKHFPVAGMVGAVIALEMALVLLRGHRQTDAPALSAQAQQFGNTRMLGIEMYTHYLYPLQIAAVLLLVAIVAAIALTLRKRKDSRQMNPSEQVRAKKADRVRLVKMPAVVQQASTKEGGQA